MTRRRRVLVERISSLIPAGSTVLDVGTGDGTIAAAIQEAKPGITLSGIDVLVRSGAAIPVAPFDGVKIPYADNSFDVVLFVDVLHHTLGPQALLYASWSKGFKSGNFNLGGKAPPVRPEKVT